MDQQHATGEARERKQAIRQGVRRLAGFSRPTLAAYLGSTPHAARTPAVVEEVYAILALGKSSKVVAVPPDGVSFLVHGPRRFLVRGRGDASGFTDEAERLVFFPKPGCAPVATLHCEAQVRKRGANVPYATRPVCLQRLTDYQYTLDGQLAYLASSHWQHVQLFAGPWEVIAAALPYWEMVLDEQGLPPEEVFRCQVGIDHMAKLVGRAVITLKRHLDVGLPTAGHSREYPGFTRACIEEFLEYAQVFPQGLSSPGQRKRWEAWRTTWRQAYQQHMVRHVRAI